MTDSARPASIPHASATGWIENRILDEIAQALQGLRFGSVEVIVHDGKVTQIERREKLRLQR